MAPRKNNNHGGTGGGAGDLQGLNGIDPETIENHDANVTRCCVPTGECLRATATNNNDSSINLEDLRDCVKVTCNNDHCTVGQYMHRECFDAWEQTVLTYLKTCGRARSWSERQRHQNLWTKKGYDLAFKACGCLCGRGHLKKDLDWSPPMPNNAGCQDDFEKKKKRRNRQNTRPSLASSANGHHLHGNINLNNNNNNNNNVRGGAGSDAQNIGTVHHGEPRGRTGSLSSSTGSSSPPTSSETSVSPAHIGHGSSGHGGGKKKSKFEFFSDRTRAGAGGNGIFSRRQDFSSFNSLPRHKLNSYHIKMEDEGNHGNDETRCFILSTLAALHTSRVCCILCQASLPVFDRYPLIDGTFFLSPRQHARFCIQVKVEGRTQYLSAVCMACLEGWGPGRGIRCRFCGTAWDGSSLVLGTMYSYDIFAAMHCCIERSKCNNCQKPMLHPHQRLNFYSDYSHSVPCPHCRTVDAHFVKPLAYCYARNVPQQPWS
ncbi:headcase protein-like [Schistocerca nitens]|uniref:headcase protein-like n=1 Tax=Schistocerca nitens TaxID=7011 RepID=UPI0021189F1B|nr:headcase protein-like [Schistocerca nitens]